MDKVCGSCGFVTVLLISLTLFWGADRHAGVLQGRQLEPCLFGLRVKRRVGEEVEVHTASSTDALKELVRGTN